MVSTDASQKINVVTSGGIASDTPQNPPQSVPETLVENRGDNRSRLCIKNLPKYYSENRLRDAFSRKGEVTDVRIMRTIDGNSREFGFVGFRTEREAEEALKYFNNTFIDMRRITCEFAHKIGDSGILRPRGRNSFMNEKHTMKSEKAINGNTCEGKSVSCRGDPKHRDTINPENVPKSKEIDDPKLLEFFDVMKSRSKTKLWDNDASFSQQTFNDGDVILSPLKDVTDDAGSNKGKLKNISSKNKSRKAALDNTLSDADYFKSRVTKDWSDSDSEDSPPDNNEPDEEGCIEEDANGSRDMALKNNDHSEDCLDQARLFVRNLPYAATEDDLKEVFSKFGDISEVHLVLDKETKKSKGFAYVMYSLPEAATRALENLDHSFFQGRFLHVMIAKQKISSDRYDDHKSSRKHELSFKQKREDARKISESHGDMKAWNSLFMRPDTIVENVARKHGMSKSDFLDQEANDVAVRIALGETQIITETKNALISAGVNVVSLERFYVDNPSNIKRSDHIILVKNLPYASHERELAGMFGRFGSLDRIILPHTKGIALIVFLDPSEAHAAFTGLSYKPYKEVPLYLEWAPVDIMTQTKPEGDHEISDTIAVTRAKQALIEEKAEGISVDDIDPDRVESRSLYVKNLNFRTSEEGLRKYLEEHVKGGKISSVKVKKHMKNGKNLSMGFGFVEFDSADTACNACRDLQGIVLDGHALVFQICQTKAKEHGSTKINEKDSMTKLVVRNVAFEATTKELRQLFSPFGQIKSLRLPKKVGQHRGFAFVEYTTKQEAQNALETLSSTHLYGRHLVLERAKEGESLEELRTRTAMQFAAGGNPTMKKRKKMLDETNVKFDQVVC